MTAALLIDINGTLTAADEPLAGAIETMARIREAGIPYRYTSNIDSRPRAEVAGWLASLGFPVGEGEVFTPVVAAARGLRGLGCHPLVNKGVLSDLGGVEFEHGQASDGRSAEAVLVGDVREGFTYENLDRAFGHLAAGAGLYALQKNRFRQSGAPGGVSLDTGAFVAALEYASGKTATVFGKPEAAFFDLAVKDLAVERRSVFVVGDDPASDVAGAQAAGLLAVQVKTGKYDPDVDPGADYTLNAFSDLPELIGL
ncbi:HAD hydrolase-like protein [Rubrobacter indicoceani]|uniref:HAD hydrolase-like protein n=1 Tax=Rubrobacter indicoceani TaxID=2051957 RepID=UPI000E5B6E66|nr:HAD hydrolase-like protein [Rubrobacter indicoceani]